MSNINYNVVKFEKMKKQIKSLFTEKTDQVFIQLFRYIFVGGFAFLVDFGMLAFFTEVCDIHYIISNTLSFIFGLLTNYFLSIFWVFTNSSLKNRKMEFIIFAVIGVIGLGLNNFLLWFCTEKIEIYYLLSKIISAAVGLFWNFFARKYLLFK